MIQFLMDAGVLKVRIPVEKIKAEPVLGFIPNKKYQVKSISSETGKTTFVGFVPFELDISGSMRPVDMLIFYSGRIDPEVFQYVYLAGQVLLKEGDDGEIIQVGTV